MDEEINRVGPDRAFEVAPFGREELFLRSESPRVQEILLHKKLQEVIDKYPNKVRYVDSELHSKNNNKRSQDFGLSEGPFKTIQLAQGNAQNSQAFSSSNSNRAANLNEQFHERCADGSSNNQLVGSRQQVIDSNCQVCLVKEIRQGLLKMTKMVVERNEELKEKCIRSHFERQIMD